MATVSCNRKPVNEKRFPIKGTVVAVNTSDRTATIKHEDIAGYMPGMTMEFRIKNDADLAIMKAGDQVTGTLVVQDLSSWVEITSITEGGAALTPTTIVPDAPATTAAPRQQPSTTTTTAAPNLLGGLLSSPSTTRP